MKSSGIKRARPSVGAPRCGRTQMKRGGKARSSVGGSPGRGTESQPGRTSLCTRFLYEFASTYFHRTKGTRREPIASVTAPSPRTSLQQVIQAECCVRTWQGSVVHVTRPRLRARNAPHTTLQTSRRTFHFTGWFFQPVKKKKQPFFFLLSVETFEGNCRDSDNQLFS